MGRLSTISANACTVVVPVLRFPLNPAAAKGTAVAVFPVGRDAPLNKPMALIVPAPPEVISILKVEVAAPRVTRESLV